MAPERHQSLFFFAWNSVSSAVRAWDVVGLETVRSPFCRPVFALLQGSALWYAAEVVSWKIADVIDFEWFLAGDGDVDDTALRARDRQIFEKISQADALHRPKSRKEIFRAWLEMRRRQTSETPPGEYFLTAWQTLSVLSALAGAAIGISVAAAVLLTYRGDEPVNVAWFFACTVGIQWLILAAALGLWLLRRTAHLFENFHPVRKLLSGLLWSLSAALHQLPGERRERIRARLMRIRRKGEVFQLLVWPLVMITQIFGVFFNAGVLIALLLPLGRDVAFGWQSTLKTSPETVYKLVSSIAAPWSFLPNAHPARQQVVQSRFSYSEGIKSLSLPAMTSWWPFLFYATFFYGFLVRLVLLIWCGLSLRAALRGFSFDHANCSALFRRLTGPFIQGHPETAKLAVPEAFPSVDHNANGSCLALIASELEIQEDQIETGLRAGFGWRLSRPVLSVRIDDPGGNADALERIAREAPSLTGVAVLIGARRAPIRAIALVLRKIAEAAGGEIEVLVLLAGSRESNSHEPVEEFSTWRNFLAIHDLRLGLERWRS
jgi:hypothetical protein